MIRGRWSSGMVDEIVCQTAALDGHDVAIREEQEPGSSGKAVIAARARKLIGYDYQGIRATGDKETRWRPLAAYVESNNVYALKAAWNKAWLEELSVVPNANHDDQADSVSGAFNELAIPTKKRARSLRSGPSRLQKLLQQRNRPR